MMNHQSMAVIGHDSYLDHQRQHQHHATQTTLYRPHHSTHLNGRTALSSTYHDRLDLRLRCFWVARSGFMRSYSQFLLFLSWLLLRIRRLLLAFKPVLSKLGFTAHFQTRNLASRAQQPEPAAGDPWCLRRRSQHQHLSKI